MKSVLTCQILIVFTLISKAQNVVDLLDKIPAVILSSDEAFKDCRPQIEKLLADDGKEVSKIKSWEYGLGLQQWMVKLDRITATIDKRAESGSFSLDNYAGTDKEGEKMIGALSETETKITSIWGQYQNELNNINPDFFPLNENEFGCEEIRSSAKMLETFAVKIQQQLSGAKIALTPLMASFQSQYDEIQSGNNSFIKNQSDGYLSTVIQIFGLMTNQISASYKNMVDTEMAFFNGQCTQ